MGERLAKHVGGTRRIAVRGMALGLSGAMVLMTGLSAARGQAEPAAETTAAPAPAETPGPAPVPGAGAETKRTVTWHELLQPGDRILFVGDEVTQQMTYTRAAEAALLAVRPEARWRFFNGGMEGASATSALTWIDDLLALAHPQVVFVSLGLHDLDTPAPTADATPPAESAGAGTGEGNYVQAMVRLTQRIQETPGVRQVVLLGPSAVQPGVSLRVEAQVTNAALARLNKELVQAAHQRHAVYLDMFSYSRAIYDAATQTQGEPLTYDGVMPNDLGGVVLASIILHGLGVEPAELERVGWAPIAPRKMARVRVGLAEELKPATLEQADKSAALYVELLRHDQAFFRAWRLAGKAASAGPRAAALSRADEAWARVEETLRQLYGPPPKP